MTGTLAGSGRALSRWQKLLIDVMRGLADRKARVVLDSDVGTWVELDGDGFPLFISIWPEPSVLGTDLIVCRAPVYDSVTVDATLYRWLATDAQSSLCVKVMLVPEVQDLGSDSGVRQRRGGRRSKGMLDAVWVAPLFGMDAETMANAVSELALVAAACRAFVDARGGGAPAFERLVASGFAAGNPIDYDTDQRSMPWNQ